MTLLKQHENQAGAEIGVEEEVEQGVEAVASGKVEGVGEVVFSEVVYRKEDQEVEEIDHFRRYKYLVYANTNSINTNGVPVSLRTLLKELILVHRQRDQVHIEFSLLKEMLLYVYSLVVRLSWEESCHYT